MGVRRGSLPSSVKTFHISVDGETPSTRSEGDFVLWILVKDKRQVRVTTSVTQRENSWIRVLSVVCPGPARVRLRTIRLPSSSFSSHFLVPTTINIYIFFQKE